MPTLREDTASRQFRRYVRERLPAWAPPRPERGWADGWAAVVAAGLPALNLPLDAGGLELGEGGLAIGFEELGVALVDGPLLDTLAVADCLGLAGDVGPVWSLLAGIAAGEVRVAVAGGYAPGGSAALRLVDGVLNGTAAVAHPAVTHLFAAVPAEHGPVLVLVPADRVLDGMKVCDEDVVARAANGRRIWERAVVRTRIRHAAYLTGLAAGAWTCTARYARQRRQFGNALADFQSVAFRLAALTSRLTGVRLAVERAAWAEDTGTDASAGATEALCLAAELALDASRAGMQLHGARGMLRDTPIQAYYVQAMAAAGRLGPVRLLWQELGARRLAAARAALVDGDRRD